MDARTAIEVYRNKEAVENSLDMKRLRIHSYTAMDARFFIQFIALIILSRFRQLKNQHHMFRHLTTREVMELMETISMVSSSDRKSPLVTEAGVKQGKIMEFF